MKESESFNLKEWLDKFLILNLFVIFAGFFFFLIGVGFNAIGDTGPYRVFQRLWFPLFIPAISTFFTAVLIEAIWKRFEND